MTTNNNRNLRACSITRTQTPGPDADPEELPTYFSALYLSFYSRAFSFQNDNKYDRRASRVTRNDPQHFYPATKALRSSRAPTRGRLLAGAGFGKPQFEVNNLIANILGVIALIINHLSSCRRRRLLTVVSRSC